MPASTTLRMVSLGHIPTSCCTLWILFALLAEDESLEQSGVAQGGAFPNVEVSANVTTPTLLAFVLRRC